MKLTSILVIALTLQVSAAASSQTITFSGKSVAFKKVLSVIKNQTNYVFFYDVAILKNVKPISINVVNAPVEKVLEQAFLDAPITWIIEGKTISFVPKFEIAKKSINLAPVIMQIKGKVTDEKGEPLAGATILIKGTKKAVVTDFDGKFTIDVPDSKSVLVVSYTGFIAKEVAVGAGGNSMEIQLVEDNTALDDVVVVGYGKQKKGQIVGAVSTVKGEQMRFPTRNLTNNMAGQVAGLIAIQRSGEPGYDNSEFFIRGISTFSGAGAKPLILVDGVPRAINDIEPDEIDTFTVLKDAASTAVYGAEGANGVIIITSKRGRAQKPVISFRTEHSLSQPTRLPKFVDSADYLELYNEALRNDGQTPIYSDALISKYRNNVDPDLYPNTDWLGTMLKKLTDAHRYTLNVRGGTEQSRYFVSGAYYGESGIFQDNPNPRYETNIGVKRFNLRSNIDMDISKTTLLSVDLSGQYLVNRYPGTFAVGTLSPSATIFRQMMITPPHLFPPVYSDGTLSTFNSEAEANKRNPYNLLHNAGYSKEWRSSIQSAVRLEQKLDVVTPGLYYRGLVSYDYNGNFSAGRIDNPSKFLATGRDANGNLIFSTSVSGTPDLPEPVETSNATKNVYMESSLNYKRVFDRHTVEGMALYMQKESQLNTEALAFRKQGIVGRATYSFDNRYFIEGNFGYTGSEKFADGYRYGFFPAVGIGYQISNEKFYPEGLKDYLTTLRFRASMGRTGNDETLVSGADRFLYRPTFGMAAGGFNQGITSGGGSNGLGAGIIEGRAEAPYLGWEIEEKQNYGVNIGLFNGRVEIIADYFKSERTSILLQRRTIPGVAGFRQAPYENFGKVKNWGIDGSLNANQTIGDLKIGFRSTFTFARNEITEYDELPQPYPWMATTGSRIGDNVLYIAERLYTDDDFVITQNTNGTNSYALKSGIPVPTLNGRIGPGDIKYEDLNGDGLINQFDRKVGVGNPTNPEINYGAGLNLEYKGFYVSAFFQGTANTSVIFGGNTPEAWNPFAFGVDQSNYRTFALDRWTEANPSQNVLMPRLHSIANNGANNNVQSTWWLKDGSFLRLKNVEIGYNLPKFITQQAHINTARIYMMGYNLTVWDKIKHWDPETGNGNAGLNYPLPRTITFGLELTL
ncbi:SusC/RagA family TonB-linked outer membrane protein [Flavobacterium sp. GT3P67]|nr:SusC/RagA family TonB-linked outer membrane protein [Flavobacterium sp. GT3P67]